jgi:hypothetical protein
MNIQSARDCVALYDAIVSLRPRSVDLDWILRAAVVFAVSALDTYFHDKVKYRTGKFDLVNMPPALAKFQIPIRELSAWESATRKGNVLRNWIEEYLSTRPLQSRSAIVEALKLVGIEALWDTIEPDTRKKDNLLAQFDFLMLRRNQISHEGDRMKSRKSGKKLRAVNRDLVVDSIDFTQGLVDRIETAFPD